MNHFSQNEVSELKVRFSNLYSGVVYDALYEEIKPLLPYVLSKEVKPAWGFDEVLCGPAFTVQGNLIQDPSHANTTFIDMFNALYKGCVHLVSSGTTDSRLAVFGEIGGKLAARHGAVGTIIDSPIRDIKKLRDDGYKIFSEGVSMLDGYGRWHVVNYQVPLPYKGADGDVWVYPGDYIFADMDGVLVIPHKETWRTLEFAEKLIVKEKRIHGHIKNGMSVKKILDIEGRW